MSTITAVTVSGPTKLAIDPSQVEYQVTITRGGTAPQDGATASTCAISIWTDSAADFLTLRAGSSLFVYKDDGSGGDQIAFTGTLSDVALEHRTNETGRARVKLKGIGNIARLGQYQTGAISWDQEGVNGRAARIIGTLGLTPDINLDTTAMIAKTITSASDNDTALSSLEEIIQSIGAIAYDTADGSIVVQGLAQRAIPQPNKSWESYRPLSAFVMWSGIGLTSEWSGQTYSSATSPAPVTLPASGVAWEPTFTQTNGSIVNYVDATYGSPSTHISSVVTDTGSISDFGRRGVTITTQLTSNVDATTRAQLVVNAASQPYWNLADVTVAVEQLSSVDAAAVQAIRPGDRVIIPSLPQPAPYTSYLGNVEGYTESFTPNKHRITFSVSNPRWSGSTAPWSSIAGTKTWAAVNAARHWYDIVASSDVN